MEIPLFNKEEFNELKKNFSKLDLDDEFEIMYGGYNKNNSLNMKKFLDMMKFMKSYSDEKNLALTHSDTLDISYNYDKTNFNTYRISINGIDKINVLTSSFNNRKNHIIFSILSSKILSSEKDLSIMNKIKNRDNIYDINEYDFRIRISKEKKVSSSEIEKLVKLENVDKLAINFRFKNRLSLILENNDDIELRVDLTSVKQSNNLNLLQKITYNYELEIDLNKKKKLSPAKEKQYIELLTKNILLIKKVLEKSNHVISNSEKQNVLNKYNEIIYGKEQSLQKSLYGMASVSLEMVHLVDTVPNRYSITDKADGERYLGIIFNDKLYLINVNLEVTYSGLRINSKNSKYNNTIIDGEYIFIPKFNKFIFAAFDILFYGNQDVRSIVQLKDRYNKLNEVLRDCFDYKFESIVESFEYNLEKISNLMKKNLTNYINYMNTSLKKSKSDNIVVRKFFMFVTGGSNNEFFKYASDMWYIYTKNKNIILPYTLDGLVFTPQEQKYTTNLKDTKFRIFKWKPPNLNSIDFFVKFEKDPETGKSLNVYDDSNESNISGRHYKIINLYNGKNINNIEVPVLFKREDNLHIAHIFLDNNSDIIKDIEGDIIQDNTVVEFAYNNDLDTSFYFRWIPLRTRHDKTDSVNKFKKKYGNNSEIANKIWNSIQHNVTIDDLYLLSDSKKYDDHMNELKKRIDPTAVAIEKQQDVYYQQITNLGKALRNFHNYIKSNIIFSYCSPKMVDGKQKKLSILDIACGRGGDIQKFFHSRIQNYVGIDVDPNGIHSSSNGAISRYNNFKKKMPYMPKMDFMIADAGGLLDYDSQLNTIGKMSSVNEELIKKYFGNDNKDNKHSKFDVINCQMALHFFFKNDTVWDNFCSNINKFLNDEGYLLITTFDGDLIHNTFESNKNIISSFYTENGESKKFFQFSRIYDNDEKDINKLGLSYKSYVAMIKDDENNYDIEYLVGKNYLVNSLKQKCNIDLVETNLFSDVHKQQEDFFKNIVPNEEKRETKSYLMNVAEYYDTDNSLVNASFKLTKLHRYYIFKKNKSSSTITPKSFAKPVEITEKTEKTSNKKQSKSNGLINKYLKNRTNVLEI